MDKRKKCVNKGIFTVEHLERVEQGNEHWKYPMKEDICEVDATPIVAIKPEYEWDLMSVRVQKLLLKNHVCIENAVEDLKL